MSTSINPSSQASLSTRVSLRWLPDPASENTDTIVMSLQGWYLDLRVDKETKTIDWAIAGRRIVESEEPRRVSFTHELDSHNSFSTKDCGTFTTLLTGDDLEVGSMPRPDLADHPMTDYEEIWRELGLKEGPEGPGKGLSWILESIDERGDISKGGYEITKTYVARIWGTFLVLRQVQVHGTIGEVQGQGVSARREEWDSTGWMEKYVLGEKANKLPSVKGLGNGQKWKLGDKVLIGDQWYVVRAFEDI